MIYLNLNTIKDFINSPIFDTTSRKNIGKIKGENFRVIVFGERLLENTSQIPWIARSH